MNKKTIKTTVKLKCVNRKRKSVLISVFKIHEQYFVQLNVIGTGLFFECKEYTSAPFKHKHQAYEKLEEEVTCLELNDFEVHEQIDNDRDCINIANLRSRPISPISYRELNKAQLQGLSGHPCLQIYSGIQVVIVIDELYNLCMYPANKIGMEGAKIPTVETFDNLILKELKHNEQGFTMIEGFYSSSLGLTMVDAAYINGESLSPLSYSKRYAMLADLSKKLNSKVLTIPELEYSNQALLGCGAYSVTHSSILLLKKENSLPCTVAKNIKNKGSIDTLIVDDFCPFNASLRSNGVLIECYNVVLDSIEERPSVLPAKNYDFFDYASVAPVRKEIGNREPLIFY